MENLQDQVTALLVSQYDMLIDEAEDVVKASIAEDGSMWNDNSDAEDIAEFLASDDDE